MGPSCTQVFGSSCTGGGSSFTGGGLMTQTLGLVAQAVGFSGTGGGVEWHTVIIIIIRSRADSLRSPTGGRGLVA